MPRSNIDNEPLPSRFMWSSIDEVEIVHLGEDGPFDPEKHAFQPRELPDDDDDEAEDSEAELEE